MENDNICPRKLSGLGDLPRFWSKTPVILRLLYFFGYCRCVLREIFVNFPLISPKNGLIASKTYIERMKICEKIHDYGDDCWCEPVQYYDFGNHGLYMHRCECNDRPDAIVTIDALVDAFFETKEIEEDAGFLSDQPDIM
jgi:hypothetical protein